MTDTLSPSIIGAMEVPFCQWCRERFAEGFLNGDSCCVDCADLIVERASVESALRDMLPAFPWIEKQLEQHDRLSREARNARLRQRGKDGGR